MRLLAESMFGPYQLTSRLGAGGMGTVWKALDTRLERFVALKFLNAADQNDPIALARFQRESRIVSRLNHPNLLTVFEAGIIEETPYISSELVDGHDLSQLLREKKRLSESEVTSIGEQILEGLHAAHAIGVIHRDIKPANVRLRPDGVVKLLDFGVARVNDDAAITAPNGVIGSPRFVAPERFGGCQTDFRSDLFSVGALLYQLLTGQPAVKGSSVAEVVQNLLHQKIETLEPTSPLRVTINRALKKNPKERHQSALEMLRALQCKGPECLKKEESTEAFPVVHWRPSVIFCPVSSAESDSALAEGLHLEANTKLGSHGAVRLLAPLTYQGHPEVTLSLAEELNADFLFTSRLRRSGELVRYNLSFVEVASKEQVWSDYLELESSDEFHIEDQCVEWMAQAVSSHFEKTSSEGDTEDTWRAQLEAILAKIWTGDRVIFAEGTEELRKLTEANSQKPLLHGRLANSYLHRARLSDKEFEEFYQPALHHIETCLTLDPNSHLGHLAKAESFITPYSAQWGEAEAAWRKAFSLAPTCPEVNLWKAYFDVTTGSPQRGALRAQKILENEPNFPDCLTVLSLCHLSMGQLELASEVANRILRARPYNALGLSLVFMSDLMKGKRDEAIRFARYLERHQARIQTLGARDYLVDSLLFVARALVDPEAARQEAITSRDFLLSSRLAARVALDGFAILEEEASVQSCLDRLVETDFANVEYLKNDPLLAQYQDRDWFLSRLEKMTV